MEGRSRKQEGGRIMKRSVIVLIAVLVVIAAGLVFLLIEGQAQRGPGMMGPGYGMGPGPMMGWGGYGGPQYCPYCGSYLGPGYGMGPGMMSPGYGMGPGMMHRGWGMGPQYQPPEKPLGKKDAKAMLENYVQSLYNPDLKVGKITEKDAYFEGEILTKDNVKVDTILVDKNTGWMQSATRGPGMRGRGWGHGYGMGPGMMGPGYQGYGPQYGSPYGPQYQGPQGPLKEKDVKAMLENYVQSTRNPNLKVGKITEKDAYFEGEIVTKNDALVDKILVDKNTGWMRSIY
jgi:hypothetical protein